MHFNEENYLRRSRLQFMLCAFSNYLEREGATRSALDFFYKGATSIVGTGTTIEVPDLEGALAYQPEPEIAYVIGRRARHAPRRSLQYQRRGPDVEVDGLERLSIKVRSHAPRLTERWRPPGLRDTGPANP